MTMYLGSNRFFNIKKITGFNRPMGFKISESRPCFLIKGDLQDVGKTPDIKQLFTIRRIILVIEDK